MVLKACKLGLSFHLVALGNMLFRAALQLFKGCPGGFAHSDCVLRLKLVEADIEAAVDVWSDM